MFHTVFVNIIIHIRKKFFDRGTNWKDFPKVTSYEEYRKITDKQHLSKAKSMPIKFLKASGKGFFIDKDGYALGIRDELADVIKVDAFKQQMKDIIMKLKYINSNGEISERIAEPLKLYFKSKSWYLIAYCRKNSFVPHSKPKSQRQSMNCR